MKEIYTKPQAEIEEFAVAEVLTASSDGNENMNGSED